MSNTPGETEAEEALRVEDEEIPVTKFLVRLGRAINWVLSRPKSDAR